jgi:hypothetical protein
MCFSSHLAPFITCGKWQMMAIVTKIGTRNSKKVVMKLIVEERK